MNKGISSHFQVSHSLALSSLTPGTYHFGATYVGDKQTGPHEVPFVFFKALIKAIFTLQILYGTHTNFICAPTKKWLNKVHDGMGTNLIYFICVKIKHNVNDV